MSDTQLEELGIQLIEIGVPDTAIRMRNYRNTLKEVNKLSPNMDQLMKEFKKESNSPNMSRLYASMCLENLNYSELQGSEDAEVSSTIEKSSG